MRDKVRRVSELPQHELAARARAAIAYAGKEYKEFAELFHVDRTHLARKLGKKGKDHRASLTDKEIETIRRRTEVPAWWFEADFNQLRPMTPEEIAEEAARRREDRRPRDVASEESSRSSRRGA